VKIKVFVYPHYITLVGAFGPARRSGGEALKDALDAKSIELEREFWQGTLESVPRQGHHLVRASTMMSCNHRDLARLCAELGHLYFYDTGVFDATGGAVDPAKALDEWLAKYHPAPT
jgi:hypothetical protein